MDIETLNKIQLKKEGVVTLQLFFLFLLTSLEYLVRHTFGIISGATILLLFILGNRFGRTGVAFAAVTTPPIAFAATALFWALLANGVHISKIFVDFVGALATVAPWMIAGAIYGWIEFYRAKRVKP